MTTLSSQANDLSATLKELDDLKSFFTAAQNQLQVGQITDITGVEKRVAVVCEIVQKAAPAQQEAYLPELTVLIDLLNGYEEDLRRLQAVLSQPNTESGNA